MTLLSQAQESVTYLAASAPALSFIGWLVIGGLAGWIGSKIMGTDGQMGLGLNILVGIIGGFLGGWVLSLIGFDVAGGGKFFSFLTCLVGSCLFLWIFKLISGKK
ncbi:GlsB/YeaQ/YmgE family stress response membrane protein [Corynebacterium sp. sy017]|uniref:GlsB/YeaQ/YmgE family stress response membrane protein n=1 Tax=unclassified Corynebacterium TaxID=2624378 RepID=UPI0011851A32|nr:MULTISPECIES: GlsB/YeaQ/YmgE family stress response membrane protein [unclassified Corynebacterium]MBP3087582.1 GlsB/YeaQ/YmgE family stress response membrane protein [Corynebacterium sp. sy017]QDZ42583.1 GlsB/YeaQ/YmgE family stress response membrane protein [Corynebacterium sp. sy039]TSD92157.1 GlsB/YeaQ/YmgE family stress response membrane protein [Corynebacterium sp. SY003]